MKLVSLLKFRIRLTGLTVVIKWWQNDSSIDRKRYRPTSIWMSEVASPTIEILERIFFNYYWNLKLLFFNNNWNIIISAFLSLTFLSLNIVVLISAILTLVSLLWFTDCDSWLAASYLMYFSTWYYFDWTCVLVILWVQLHEKMMLYLSSFVKVE